VTCSVFKKVWAENVRTLLADNDITVAEAARLLGTSKQYLTTILGESLPQSTKEQVVESLSLLLHAHPGRLYSPLPLVPEEQLTTAPAVNWQLLDMPVSAAEQAVLAERHFLGGDYRGSLAFVRHLLAAHGESLLPIATAQAQLLAGKSACLLGQSALAREYLKLAQRVFQKRVSAQPQKYLPLCLECYRYGALAAHMERDYALAMKLQRQALQLLVKHRGEDDNLGMKWETLGQNILRTVVKQGRLSGIVAVADELEALAGRLDSPALSERAVFTRQFALYAVARAQGIPGQQAMMPPPQLVRDAYIFLHYGLVLWDRGGDLRLFTDSLPVDTGSEELALVHEWLSNLAETGETKLRFSSTNTLKPWGLLIGACTALESDALQAFHMWQEALFDLKANRDIPLYLYSLAMGLDKFSAHITAHNRQVLQAVLDKVLSQFTA